MPASEKVSPGSFRAVVVNGVGCEGTFAKEGVVDNIITPKRRRRKCWFILAVVSILLVWLYIWSPEDAVPPPTSPGPVGIWYGPVLEIAKGNYTGLTFRYDGQYVTLSLCPRWSWEWHPDDYYWRLETRWVENDLYVRFSTDFWMKYATFTDGQFRDREGRLFVKIALDAFDSRRGLLRKRPPCDYSIDHLKCGRTGAWIYLVPYCVRPWVDRPS